MHHSAKDVIAKIRVMLIKAETLQRVEEKADESPVDHKQLHKYLQDDIKSLAREIAYDGN